MTNYDVHFGLKGEGFGHAGIGHFISDGDGWNVWGEQPGTDANDDTTTHGILRCESLGKAIQAADALFAQHGFDHGLAVSNPTQVLTERLEDYVKGSGYSDGDLIVVTTSEDWAEVVYTIDNRATTLHQFVIESRA